MDFKKYFYSLLYLYLFSVVDVISDDLTCDITKCKGPIKYYEDLKCTPAYGSENPCCPVKYNCDHLQGRSKDKCYYNGHEYEPSQPLREEDATPCNIGCFCSQLGDDIASFTCPIIDCIQRPAPGCYLKHSHTACCPEPAVCPPGVERPQCQVDGKTYLDGQRFTPESDPTLSCICSEGYTGENVEPFCKPARSPSCGIELRRAYDIYNNCTPVYYSSQNPATDCSVDSRCQNSNDVVEEAEEGSRTGIASDPTSICTFGHLTMKIGDKLKSGTDANSVCVKCVCEMPPLPTCQRLPDSECDVTAGHV